MQFKQAALIGAGCLLGSTQALFSPSNVVDVVGRLTDIASDVENTVEDESLTTLVEKLPKIISNVTEIASTVLNDISGKSDTKSLNKDEQLNVCSTFKKFANEGEQLISTVVEKAADIISSPLPFSYLLSALFRNIDDVVDKLFGGLVDVVPVCKDDFKENKNIIKDGIGKALHALTDESED